MRERPIVVDEQEACYRTAYSSNQGKSSSSSSSGPGSASTLSWLLGIPSGPSMYARQIVKVDRRLVLQKNGQKMRWVCGFENCDTACKDLSNMEAHVRDKHIADNARTDYELCQCAGNDTGMQSGGTCFVKATLEDGGISTRTFVVSTGNTAPASSVSHVSESFAAVAFPLLSRVCNRGAWQRSISGRAAQQCTTRRFLHQHH